MSRHIIACPGEVWAVYARPGEGHPIVYRRRIVCWALDEREDVLLPMVGCCHVEGTRLRRWGSALVIETTTIRPGEERLHLVRADAEEGYLGLSEGWDSSRQRQFFEQALGLQGGRI